MPPQLPDDAGDELDRVVLPELRHRVLRVERGHLVIPVALSVSGCSGRAAKKITTSSARRAGDQSGTQELVIKTAAGLNGYGFAEPNAVGSHVSVWLNELVDAREALEAFRAGC